jgi:hypothetical protein
MQDDQSETLGKNPTGIVAVDSQPLDLFCLTKNDHKVPIHPVFQKQCKNPPNKSMQRKMKPPANLQDKLRHYLGINTFSERHTSVKEKTASFTCIRKLNISAYIFNPLGVKTMLIGQSTR